MKKLIRLTSFALVAILLAVGLFGCYGNMSLTKQVYNWNGSLSDKYVQQIAFWVMNIVPVYSAASFIDVVLLNTIEFWTGSNPIAMNETEQQIKYTRNGDKTIQYKISQNKVIITETAGPEAGQQVEVSYNPETGSWYLSSDGEQHKIATLSGDDLSLVYPNGNEQLVKIAR